MAEKTEIKIEQEIFFPEEQEKRSEFARVHLREAHYLAEVLEVRTGQAFDKSQLIIQWAIKGVQDKEGKPLSVPMFITNTINKGGFKGADGKMASPSKLYKVLQEMKWYDSLRAHKEEVKKKGQLFGSEAVAAWLGKQMANKKFRVSVEDVSPKDGGKPYSKIAKFAYYTEGEEGVILLAASFEVVGASAPAMKEGK